MREMRRRLGNSEKAADLPGTLLMRLVEQYIKAVEKRNEIEQAKLEQEEIDAMEMIDQPGLPLDYRVEMLEEFLGEIQDVWLAGSARLEELYALRDNENEDDGSHALE